MIKPVISALALFSLSGIFFKGYGQLEKIKLNQLQVIGSHNSYKQAIEPALFQFIQSKDTTGQLSNLQYTHISLTAQLELGLRNLEIDVLADSKGGKYAKPKGLELVKPTLSYDEQGLMTKPGFKVLHMPDLDFRSSVLTFEKALQELKAWSDAHPDHVPLFITLEPKDGEVNRFGTQSEAFTTTVFDQLDSCILANLGKDKLITPDLVRGSYQSLEEAVLHQNWPELNSVRGRFFFLLDDSGKKKDLYVAGHPSLKGRLIFVNADPGTPEAAAMFRNDPNDAQIPALVAKGYIVRTRADADTKEARLNDYSRFNKAKASGAQVITTDYYQPSTFFSSAYHIQFEDGTYVRNNPVNQR